MGKGFRGARVALISVPGLWPLPSAALGSPGYVRQAFKLLPGGPRSPKHRPKTPKMASRRPRRHPRRPKRPPRGLPRGPQEAKIVDFHWFLRCFLSSHFFGFPTLQDSPRGSQNRSKTAQEASKTAPRRPKRLPKASQDGPRWPQDGPGAAQDGPRRAPTGLQDCLSEPSGPQEGPARP